MIFQLCAILALVFFYAIYICKMILQRKQGIKTDQIASKGKEGSLYITELVMKIATYVIILAELISIILNTHMINSGVRITGIVIAVFGDMIFAIAVYTMRDSWRAGIAKNDRTELITNGIYSISRNPAFLGFYLLYIGVLLMFFNWILFGFTSLAIIMLHLQILQEEKHLTVVFGISYVEYKNKVNRYLGRLKIYNKEEINE